VPHGCPCGRWKCRRFFSRSLTTTSCVFGLAWGTAARSKLGGEKPWAGCMGRLL